MNSIKRASRQRVEQIRSDARESVVKNEGPLRYEDRRRANEASRELRLRGEEL